MPEQTQALVEHDQLDGIQISSEIPPSHDGFDINPEAITKEGLVKACAKFREIAESNPKLAEKMAEQAIESVKERAAMREENIDEGAIKKRQWSSMSERGKQKAQPEAKQEPEKIQPAEKRVSENTVKPEPIKKTTAEEYPIEPVISATEITIPIQQDVVMLTHQAEATRQRIEILKNSKTMERVKSVLKEDVVYDKTKARIITDSKPVIETTESSAPATTPEQDIAASVETEQMVVNVAEENAEQISDQNVQDTEHAIDVGEPEFGILEIHQSETLLGIPELIDSEEIVDDESVPIITRTVTERLSELPLAEKESTGILIADMVEAVQTIQKLQLQEATQVLAEAQQVELEEMIVSLFGQLSIKYKPEDIKQFMAALGQPDVQRAIIEGTPIDKLGLEHLGTHEAKHRFGKMMRTMTEDVERDIKQLLGVLALLQTANG